ncbi:MAG: polysaccharide pyruvyl transferase family protein [Bacteroidales bacterium]|nr:polysaccharide pyruvyl transferase family protein [Bacteroidales bacterium]
MKTGILTFHAADNYGAVLQCRCLYEVLKSLGHEVSVIDYRPEYLTAPYRLWKNSYLKHPMTMLKVSASLAGAIRRKKEFERFVSEMALTPFGQDGFDAIFYGSDQIWNRNITGGIDPVFFAAAPFATGAKNISYAASDGNIIPQEDEQKEMRTLLHNFHRIGVREATMQRRMDESGIPAVLNLDPVLLAGTSILDQIRQPVKENGYVVTYEAIDDPKVLSMANSIAAERGLKVISIARSPYREGSNKYGPAEFISLIRGADCVVTTSFHAIALALLYHKEFHFARTGTAADDRILSLLGTLGVTGDTQLNYDELDARLEALRKESMNYIIEALQ